MAASAQAYMATVYDGDERRAFELIEDAIKAYPTNKYPQIAKMDIATRFGSKAALRECLNSLRDEARPGSEFYNGFKKAEAIYTALNGDLRKALKIATNELPNFSEAGRVRLVERLNSIAAKL